MFELLFLLLPIAAAYGYYMGKNGAKDKRQKDSLQKHTNYLHGVEYLLNDEKDRAVDKFIAYLNEADPSFENNIALGNLFRKRGEVDKAISMHQALLHHSNLEESEHEIVKLELARDFISAGLLDRAEDILLEVVDIPRMRELAAMLLLKLYEQERDYNKAISVALEYRDYIGKVGFNLLAHYYCENADQALIQGEHKKALSIYQTALELNDNSIRAKLGLAKIYIQLKDQQKALNYIHAVEQQDNNYGLQCLELLQLCFINEADPAYRLELELLIKHTHSASAMDALVKLVEQSSLSEAELLITSFIKDNANLKLFSALMRVRSKLDNNSSSILEIKALVDAQIARNNKYSCTQCGFDSKLYFWQCPSCRQWGSMHTLKGLDGD